MPGDSSKDTFQFDFQPKPSEKKKTPSSSAGKPSSKPVNKPISKPAGEASSFDFGKGESKPQDAAASNNGTPKSKPAFSSPVTGKTSAVTGKTSDVKTTSNSKTTSSGKTAQKTDKPAKGKKSKGFLDNQQNVLMLGIGGGLFFLLIIFALVFGGGSNEEVKKPKAPARQVSAEERTRQIRAEKLRRQAAKYDAEYAASKRGPKSEKVKILELADSQLRSGQIRDAADSFEKAHNLDPADGYPVTQLIQIYRDRLHNSAQTAKWEKIGSDIAKGNLDRLHQQSEEKYHTDK